MTMMTTVRRTKEERTKNVTHSTSTTIQVVVLLFYTARPTYVIRIKATSVVMLAKEHEGWQGWLLEKLKSFFGVHYVVSHVIQIK